MVRLVSWLLLLVSAGPIQAALVYQIDSGSTISILGTGQVEQLSGSFEWVVERYQADYVAMRPVALTFESASTSLSLNLTTPNPVGTSIFFLNDPDRCTSGVCETFFGAVVDSVGLGTNDPLSFDGFGTGQYTGNPFAPDSVTYTNYRLVPEVGGAFLARLDFSATLAPAPVPIPAGIWLLSSALLGLTVASRRSKNPEGVLLAA